MRSGVASLNDTAAVSPIPRDPAPRQRRAGACGLRRRLVERRRARRRDPPARHPHGSAGSGGRPGPRPPPGAGPSGVEGSRRNQRYSSPIITTPARGKPSPSKSADDTPGAYSIGPAALWDDARPMREIDLLVVGDCNPDLVLAGAGVRPAFGQGETWVDEARLVVGGTSSITACGAARLGLRTAMAGVVGDDLFGRFMLAELARMGVDTAPMVTDPGQPDRRLDRARRAGRPGHSHLPRHDRRPEAGDGPRRAARPHPARAQRRLLPAGSGGAPDRRLPARPHRRRDHLARPGRRPRRALGRRAV